MDFESKFKTVNGRLSSQDISSIRNPEAKRYIQEFRHKIHLPGTSFFHCFIMFFPNVATSGSSDSFLILLIIIPTPVFVKISRVISMLRNLLRYFSADSSSWENTLRKLDQSILFFCFLACGQAAGQHVQFLPSCGLQCVTRLNGWNCRRSKSFNEMLICGGTLCTGGTFKDIWRYKENESPRIQNEVTSINESGWQQLAMTRA